MVVIRLARGGANKRPFYRIVVSDRRVAATGRFIEHVGYYNPKAAASEPKLRVDIARVDHWVGLGAQMSERVAHLVRDERARAA